MYFVYILCNFKKTVLYVGVSNDLRRRVSEHKELTNPQSFTAKYKVIYLVYYEEFQDIEIALKREKQLKGGNRKRKIELIESINPFWSDLAFDL